MEQQMSIILSDTIEEVEKEISELNRIETDIQDSCIDFDFKITLVNQVEHKIDCLEDIKSQAIFDLTNYG